MGYFASLMRQTGLRPPAASSGRESGSYAIDVDDTRVAEASPPLDTGPVAGSIQAPVRGADLHAPSLPPVAIVATSSSPMFARKVDSSPAQQSIPPAFVSQVTHPALTPPVDGRSAVAAESTAAAEVSDSPGEPPKVRVGQSAARSQSGITFEDVRAWVAEPIRNEAEDIPRRTLMTEPLREATRALSLGGSPVEQRDETAVKENYSLEIGTIQILIEEPQTPPAKPLAVQRPASEPASHSWMLASRHYLRP